MSADKHIVFAVDGPRQAEQELGAIDRFYEMDAKRPDLVIAEFKKNLKAVMALTTAELKKAKRRKQMEEPRGKLLRQLQSQLANLETVSTDTKMYSEFGRLLNAMAMSANLARLFTEERRMTSPLPSRLQRKFTETLQASHVSLGLIHNSTPTLINTEQLAPPSRAEGEEDSDFAMRQKNHEAFKEKIESYNKQFNQTQKNQRLLEMASDRFSLAFETMAAFLKTEQHDALSADESLRALRQGLCTYTAAGEIKGSQTSALKVGRDGVVDWQTIQTAVKKASEALLTYQAAPTFAIRAYTTVKGEPLDGHNKFSKTTDLRHFDMRRKIILMQMTTELLHSFKPVLLQTKNNHDPLQYQHNGQIEKDFKSYLKGDYDRAFYKKATLFKGGATAIGSLGDYLTKNPEASVVEVYQQLLAASHKLSTADHERHVLLESHLQLAVDLVLSRPKTKANLKEMVGLFYLLPLGSSVEGAYTAAISEHIQHLPNAYKLIFLQALCNKQRACKRPNPMVARLLSNLSEAAYDPADPKFQYAYEVKFPGQSEPSVLSLRAIADSHNKDLTKMMGWRRSGAKFKSIQQYQLDLTKIPEPILPAVPWTMSDAAPEPEVKAEPEAQAAAMTQAFTATSAHISQDRLSVIGEIRQWLLLHQNTAGTAFEGVKFPEWPEDPTGVYADLDMRLKTLETTVSQLSSVVAVEPLQKLISKAKATEVIHQQRQQIRESTQAQAFYQLLVTQLSAYFTSAIAVAGGNTYARNAYANKTSAVFKVIGGLVPPLKTVGAAVKAMGGMYKKKQCEFLASLTNGDSGQAWLLAESIARLLTQSMQANLNQLELGSPEKLARYVNNKAQHVLGDCFTSTDQHNLMQGNHQEVAIKMSRQLVKAANQGFLDVLTEPTLSRKNGGPIKAEAFLAEHQNTLEVKVVATLEKIQTPWDAETVVSEKVVPRANYDAAFRQTLQTQAAKQAETEVKLQQATQIIEGMKQREQSVAADLEKNRLLVEQFKKRDQEREEARVREKKEEAERHRVELEALKVEKQAQAEAAAQAQRQLQTLGKAHQELQAKFGATVATNSDFVKLCEAQLSSMHLENEQLRSQNAIMEQSLAAATEKAIQIGAKLDTVEAQHKKAVASLEAENTELRLQIEALRREQKSTKSSSVTTETPFHQILTDQARRLGELEQTNRQQATQIARLQESLQRGQTLDGDSFNESSDDLFSWADDLPVVGAEVAQSISPLILNTLCVDRHTKEGFKVVAELLQNEHDYSHDIAETVNLIRSRAQREPNTYQLPDEFAATLAQLERAGKPIFDDIYDKFQQYRGATQEFETGDDATLVRYMRHIMKEAISVEMWQRFEDKGLVTSQYAKHTREKSTPEWCVAEIKALNRNVNKAVGTSSTRRALDNDFIAAARPSNKIELQLPRFREFLLRKSFQYYHLLKHCGLSELVKLDDIEQLTQSENDLFAKAKKEVETLQQSQEVRDELTGYLTVNAKKIKGLFEACRDVGNVLSIMQQVGQVINQFMARVEELEKPTEQIKAFWKDKLNIQVRTQPERIKALLATISIPESTVKRLADMSPIPQRPELSTPTLSRRSQVGKGPAVPGDSYGRQFSRSSLKPGDPDSPEVRADLSGRLSFTGGK
jgi:hypothetical protein